MHAFCTGKRFSLLHQLINSSQQPVSRTSTFKAVSRNSRYSKSFKNLGMVLYLNPDQDDWNKEAALEMRLSWQLLIKDYSRKNKKNHRILKTTEISFKNPERDKEEITFISKTTLTIIRNFFPGREKNEKNNTLI